MRGTFSPPRFPVAPLPFGSIPILWIVYCRIGAATDPELRDLLYSPWLLP